MLSEHNSNLNVDPKTSPDAASSGSIFPSGPAYTAMVPMLVQRATDILSGEFERPNDLGVRDLSAIWLLGRFGDAESIAVLKQRFETAGEPNYRREHYNRLGIVQAIKEIGLRGYDAQAIPALQGMLPDGKDFLAYDSLQGGIGYTAAEALAAFGAKSKDALSKLEMLRSATPVLEAPDQKSGYPMKEREAMVRRLFESYRSGITNFMAIIAGEEGASAPTPDSGIKSNVYQAIVRIGGAQISEAFTGSLDPVIQSNLLLSMKENADTRHTMNEDDAYELIREVLSADTGRLSPAVGEVLTKSPYASLVEEFRYRFEPAA